MTWWKKNNNKTTIITTTNDEDPVDFDEEGRKILARVNLLKEQEQEQEKKRQWGRTKKKPLDAKTVHKQRLLAFSNPIYKDPKTGGTIHVGNYMAAERLDHLNTLSKTKPCRRIVYCLNNEVGTKPFEHYAGFQYLDFPIGLWRDKLSRVDRQDPQKVLAFFQPYFDFLDAALAHGEAVLVHCLAGAHRAGSAGIASLMYLTGMCLEEAIRTAQTLRPVIKPIGDFPKLLKLLEEGLELQRKQQEQLDDIAVGTVEGNP